MLPKASGLLPVQHESSQPVLFDEMSLTDGAEEDGSDNRIDEEA